MTLDPLLALKCGLGIGRSHIVKHHGTHKYFFCSAAWGILSTLQSNLQNEIHVHLHQQYLISKIRVNDIASRSFLFV